MNDKIKSIFGYLTNSIRKKIFFCFLIILTFLVLVTTYTLVSGRKTNDRYNVMVGKLLLLNDVFVDMDKTNISFQRYMEYYLPQDYQSYSKSRDNLLKASAELDSLEDSETGYNREIVDLKYMVISYTEHAGEAVNMKTLYDKKSAMASYLTELNLNYNQTQQVYDLVNQNFKSVYSIILSEAADVRVHIESSTRTLYIFNIALIAFAMINCAIFFNLFSQDVTKPILTLTKFASRVSMGDMQLEPLHIKSNDEMSILADAFDEMMVRINQQIHEIEENAKVREQLQNAEVKNLQTSNMLKAAELKALQSRINPHFLFNTLNMISQTAYIEEAEQTVTLIDATATLLRYNLDKLSKAVTLEDEVANVENYVFIQQKRFGSRILFKFEVDKSLGAVKIPCLVLQPLVENSIIHGVGIYLSGGEITIQVQKQNNRILLSVSDNGMGIEPQKITEMRGSLSNSDIEMTDQLGLKNVQMRLSLFFNNDVTISIRSVPKVETKITFNIPDVR